MCECAKSPERSATGQGYQEEQFRRKVLSLGEGLHEALGCDWSRHSQQGQRVDMQACIYYLETGQCCQLHSRIQPAIQSRLKR